MSGDNECISVLPWSSCRNSSVLPWNHLLAVQCEDSVLITQWNQRQMTIFQVHEKEVRDVTLSALKSATALCQDVNFPETVLQVFEWVGKLFLLTATGILKVLLFNEATIRALEGGKGYFQTIYLLPPPKKVLGAYPLVKNVLLITTVLNGHISIDVYNVETSTDEMKVFLVDSIPLEQQEPQDGTASAAMCVCNTNVASQLIGSQSDQYLIVFVGLNTGSVFWLPFIKNAQVVPEARKLYHTGRKVRRIVSLKENNKVFVLLEGGVVILITSSTSEDRTTQQLESNSRSLQFNPVALPGSIREFCLSSKSNSILCSDGIQCWLVREATGTTGTTLLPLKGVTGMLALPESDICLATAKHNTFYAVNVAADFSSRVAKDERIIQKCCDLETPCQYICELKEKTNDLLHVEAALKVEDSVLAGIAAAARGNILRASFSGRVLVHNVDTCCHSDEHTNLAVGTMYRLSVEVRNSSNIDFSANLWSVSISIVTRNGGVFSKTASLPNSFVRAFPFSTNIYVRLQSKDILCDPEIIVNLIAELPEPDHGRWISIPVFQEHLDLSYFLTVIFDTEKGSVQSKAVSIDDQINELGGKQSKNHQHSASYFINLPQQWRDVSNFMERLLSKCKHRCEDFLKQIKGGTNKRAFNLLFGDAVVTLTFNRIVSVLTLTSTSTELVHAVKLWIIQIFAGSDGDDITSPDIVTKAMGLRSVLENEQLKPSIDVGHLNEIYSEVRNNVSAALPL